MLPHAISGPAWLLALIGLWLVYRIWFAKRLIAQSKQSSELFLNPDDTVIDSPPRADRTVVAELERRLELRGYTKLVFTVHPFISRAGRSYAYVFVSADRGTICAISVMYIPRRLWFLPIWLPTLACAKRRQGLEVKSTFQGGTYLSSVGAQTLLNTYPPQLEVQRFPADIAVEKLLDAHERRLKELIERERRTVVPVESPERYFENSRAMRKLLKEFRQREQRRELERRGLGEIADRLGL